MAKQKSEHYVNNKELLESLEIFLAKVDRSYNDYFGTSITKESEDYNPTKKEYIAELQQAIQKTAKPSNDIVSKIETITITDEEYIKGVEKKKFTLIKNNRALAWKNKPRITGYIGSCFLKIATHLSYKPNFVNYMFREDMISDGIENCIQYIFNFNSDKSNNPFAYFTQIIHYAFLRRIQREKRQLEIKNKIVEKTGFESLMTSDSNLTSEYRNDYNAIKENIITKLNQ